MNKENAMENLTSVRDTFMVLAEMFVISTYENIGIVLLVRDISEYFGIPYQIYTPCIKQNN
jgi:hypothetical protein